MLTVDINCDVGEGIDNEEFLMPFISSCNIACGAHAGDVLTIDHVIKLALNDNVKIGAHPSFPDRENFGRVAMEISLAELEESLLSQVSLIKERLQLFGGTLHHVKAHGALYNLSATDEATAQVIVNVMKKVAPETTLYVPSNSVIEQIASQSGLKTMMEVFADRNYNDDLTLVSRSEKNAVLTNKEEVIKHISEMIFRKRIKTISGQLIPIKSDTMCVHGDNREAIELVKYINKSLTTQGVQIG